MLNKKFVCHIIAILVPIVAIIISKNIFLNESIFLLFSTTLSIGVGISLISFLYSSKKKRPMHHWQFSLLCPFLIIPSVIHYFVVGQNVLCKFLILFISTICITVFTKDIPDFINYLMSKKKFAIPRH